MRKTPPYIHSHHISSKKNIFWQHFLSFSCLLFIYKPRALASDNVPWTAFHSSAYSNDDDVSLNNINFITSYSLFAICVATSTCVYIYIYVYSVYPLSLVTFFIRRQHFTMGWTFWGWCASMLDTFSFAAARLVFSRYIFYICIHITQCRGFGWVSSLRCDVSVLYARAPHQINIYACRVNDAYSHGRIINPTHFQWYHNLILYIIYLFVCAVREIRRARRAGWNRKRVHI